MGEIWPGSMSGVPWTTKKIKDAVRHLRNRATVSFLAGVDTLDDLVRLDNELFSRRPDLILSVSHSDAKSRYSEELLTALSCLGHVSALQLAINHSQDLGKLSSLERMDFLVISSKKELSLDFIRSFKRLRYLRLSGKFNSLSPISDCFSLESLVLNCAIAELDFVASLPSIQYLFIDSCTLEEGSLAALEGSPLSILTLSSVRNLTSLDELSLLTNLQFLHIAQPKAQRLFDFSKLERLRQLELGYMKGLKEIDLLWTASHLEYVELKEINPGIKAEAFQRLTEMVTLRQVDFRFMDFNKGRIAALQKMMIEAGRGDVLIENIPASGQIHSLAIQHAAKHLL
ncbi:leucine-rich repeat domain-containing protein [Paenibacillus sp. CAU 1782]